MANEPNITVFYEKYYIDSISRHMPSLFESNDIDMMSIKRYWADSVDGFLSYPCLTYITCITGDIRVIIPHEHDGWKFNQYFVSEMDGKVIKIPPNTWFGIHNISESKSTILLALSKKVQHPKRMNNDIFDWHY